MPQSLARSIVRTIFSTKDRAQRLPAGIRPALYGYLAGIVKESGSTPILIGGTANHVHVLFGLSKNLALCQFIQQLKESSSKWLTRHYEPLDRTGHAPLPPR